MSPKVASTSTCTRGEAHRLGADAFVFGFPLLMAMTVMRQATNVTGPHEGRAPLNRFAHLGSFSSPGFRAMVGTNADTLYSLAWLDLSAEPIVLVLPDTEGRSYLTSLTNAWNEIITGLGPRSCGTAGCSFALAGPQWAGPLPDGVCRIDSPTNNVMVTGHLHAIGLQDLNPCRAVQERFTLAPLSAFGESYEHPESVVDEKLAAVPNPSRLVADMEPSRFFGELAAAMAHNPPLETDVEIVERLGRIGFEIGERFAWESLDRNVREALSHGMTEGREAVASPPATHDLDNGWRTLGMELGNYGSDYLRRAQVANIALGTTPPEDACFPIVSTDTDGKHTNGEYRYRLRFEPGRLPPAKALWSLAIYDMDQIFVSNSLDRYALGDRDALELSPDGSLEIPIQSEPPADLQANWLPAPEGDFYLMLHLYWPDSSVLDGSWKVPAVRRVG